VAIDYGPQGRINVLCPGPVDTPLIRASAAAFLVAVLPARRIRVEAL
jgi:NAD(P)-dependent dehydrogenase (short-subunit alcohol dehydrogenase family)